MRKCLNCKAEVFGRSDKLFCDVYCKSSFQYKKKKEEEKSLFETIDKQLKQNRKLLKSFNKAGKSTVRKEKLLAEGFNPKYFTHYWKTKKGTVYLFCYEFGFLSITENGKSKYVLVKWQEYMGG
ncbi:hypothetical protein [Brumimicrobium oceani]|uniref:DUF2116 family Zn-ribbon domain-containing protein n=1 Tax=Brumimicrobium oceani TaxID=2100725 RepID=A0A2U2X5C2_9FLAO|nr:hypothetical protein [Brumimicrobium oceani]PWH82971.1 hypothetical protein DIT68_13835 [Brumimicrobium oceani]